MSNSDLSSQLPSQNSDSIILKDKFLFVLIFSSVIIDVLINFTSYIGIETPLFAILKGVIIVAVLFFLKEKYSHAIVVLLFSIFLTRWFLILMHGYKLEVFYDLTFFLRILFFVIWLLFFHEKRNCEIFISGILKLFIWVSSINFICTVLAFLFGIGFFKAYAEVRAGYKGLFFAVNDTSVFYLIAFLYSMTLLKDRKIYIYPLLALVSLIIMGMGSKTALIGIFSVPILYFYFTAKKIEPKNFTDIIFSRIKAIFTFLLLITLGYIFYIYMDIKSILTAINYDNFIFMLDNSDLITAVLSGRDFKVADYFDSIKSVFDVLFGLQMNGGADYMLEIDLFDYLTRVGLIGTALIMHLILTASRSTSGDKIGGESKAFLVLIILLGATVGHTLISSMNGIWIAFFLVFFSKYRLVKSQTNSERGIMA